MKKLPPILEITFTAGHSLMCGHKPKQLSLEELEQGIIKCQTEESIQSFGLFGGDLAVQQFNPDIKPEDWVPQEQDYIYPVYRLLSETMVYKYGIPVDFGKPGILRNAISKLKGQTVNTNHVTEVENAIGTVVQIAWQESYTVGNIKVPAGVNGTLKIDAKSNPRIARSILSEPPAIHSTSTTVKFQWEKSHPELSDSEFMDKAGTYDKDGQMIRLLVSKVLGFKEQSLVGRGADPYAQKINADGIINDPVYASTAYNLAADKSSFNLDEFDFKDILEIRNIFDNKQSFKTNTDMEFSEILTALGLTAEDFTDLPAIKTHLESLAANSAAHKTLVTIKPDLTPDVLTSLVAEVAKVPSAEDLTLLADVKALGTLDEIKSGIASGNAHLTAVRTEAVNTFKLIHGESADANIMATIQAADLATAEAFLKTFKTELEAKIPLTCVKCGSTEVSRTGHKKAENAQMTLDEQKEALRKKNKRAKS